VEATDYSPYGKVLRQYLASTSYKFGYQGSEKEDLLGKNKYYTHFRGLDGDIARWKQVDPLTSQFPWQTPYNSMDNNPIFKTDVKGLGTESTHVDEYGKVLRSFDDGDNSVYMHKKGTTTRDINKKYAENYEKSKVTSAGGTKIGEMGKTIDVDVIATNILTENKAQAKKFNEYAGSKEYDWLNKVFIYMEWDYKNNTNTIFGAAWAYDNGKAVKGRDTHHTKFTTEGLTFLDASSFGNFNAGYTGNLANIDVLRQLRWAGFGEAVKCNSGKQILDFWLVRPPYHGDKRIDYIYNTLGMQAAELEKK
jgi:RHS repeat-associated protein